MKTKPNIAADFFESVDNQTHCEYFAVISVIVAIFVGNIYQYVQYMYMYMYIY